MLIPDAQLQTLRGKSPDFLQTTAAGDDAPAVKSKPLVNQQQWDQWAELLDNTLLNWGQNPQVLEDEEEGLQAPSGAIISLAYQIALSLRRSGMPAPNRIIPDGEGGIVLKCRKGESIATWELSAEGSLEFILYTNGRVDSRVPIPLPDFQ